MPPEIIYGPLQQDPADPHVAARVAMYVISDSFPAPLHVGYLERCEEGGEIAYQWSRPQVVAKTKEEILAAVLQDMSNMQTP